MYVVLHQWDNLSRRRCCAYILLCSATVEIAARELLLMRGDCADVESGSAEIMWMHVSADNSICHRYCPPLMLLLRHCRMQVLADRCYYFRSFSHIDNHV